MAIYLPALVVAAGGIPEVDPCLARQHDQMAASRRPIRHEPRLLNYIRRLGRVDGIGAANTMREVHR